MNPEIADADKACEIGFKIRVRSLEVAITIRLVKLIDQDENDVLRVQRLSGAVPSALRRSVQFRGRYQRSPCAKNTPDHTIVEVI